MVYLSAKAATPHHVRKFILISSFKNSSQSSAATPWVGSVGLVEPVVMPTTEDKSRAKEAAVALLLWTVDAAMTISPNWTGLDVVFVNGEAVVILAAVPGKELTDVEEEMA